MGSRRYRTFISHFEDALAREAVQRRVAGIVCGHIHKAELREIRTVLYCNTGDWVESCTALVEDDSGRLELLRAVPGSSATVTTATDVLSHMSRQAAH